MADKTKIMLSEQEQQVVNDSSWILTKQAVIQKVYYLFNEQVNIIGKIFSGIQLNYPGKTVSVIPKISKGENYQGLPYVMLDYPSVFDKENIFALRTMFWWGNYFSITLQLSGHYKQIFSSETFIDSLQSIEGLYICIHSDPWQHHFESSNYISCSQLNKRAIEDLFNQKNFVKIALKYDLKQWNNIDNLLEAAYKKIIFLLRD
jgi:hypothetical protein